MECSRRSFLSGSAILAASAGTGGCGGLLPPLPSSCLGGQIAGDPRSPLTIDVHAHVFNGSDLQIEGFISLIMRVPGVGLILQALAKEGVPTARQELSVLTEISDALKHCEAGEFVAIKEKHAEQQYQIGRAALMNAADRVERSGLRRDRELEQTIESIRSLDKNYADYKLGMHRQLGNRYHFYTLDGKSIGGVIDFILRNFQYRYVNVFDYLERYSRGHGRRTDLVVAHLVDYDWPIGGGTETTSSLQEQIEVMSQICAVTNGRVHCYAPFDPLKQVAYDLGYFRYSPLRDVVAPAVLERGFIGVKLYPPMGFRPYCNSSQDICSGSGLPFDFWNKDWIPESLKQRPDLGPRLDDAMASLWEWCLQHDVPIMAHTAPSNGPDDSFKHLSDPEWWRDTLRKFHGPDRGLRVNFGHFGDTGIVSGEEDRSMKFARLMNSNSLGNLAYADSAYFVDILGSPNKLSQRLVTLFRNTAHKGGAALAQRLMYGTDWEMIVVEGRTSDSYLQNFEMLFRTLDGDATLGSYGRLSDRFFGVNAANYLGLHSSDATRSRLAAFYQKAAVANPLWASKVDKLGSRVAFKD